MSCPLYKLNDVGNSKLYQVVHFCSLADYFIISKVLSSCFHRYRKGMKRPNILRVYIFWKVLHRASKSGRVKEETKARLG